MKDLSLHILDIAQNSLSAGASLLELSLILDGGTLTVTVADNGRGMPPAFLSRAADPFTTTRATRRLGLGLPLWKQAAEQAGGAFSLASEEGKGTVVTASFQARHVDTPPPGDMAGTLVTLLGGAPGVDLTYRQGRPGKLFALDTRELRGTLSGVRLDHPDVLDWVRGYLGESLPLYPIS